MISINGNILDGIETVYKNWVKSGEKYTSPDGKTIIFLGNDCILGTGCMLGDGCKIGVGCMLGDYCKIGDGCKIGNGCKIGVGCILGDGCKIGDGCMLGDGCELGDDYKLPVQPLWFCGIKYSIGYYSPGFIKSGCILKPVKWWQENIKRCAEEYHYTPEQIKEYEFRVKCLVEWMKIWDVYESRAR
jgi:NDP-sugar pyrophosphorylase family protein